MKSEKEKMLSGEPYLAADAELTALHRRAQELLFEFNALPLAEAARRRALLVGLFGAVGANVDVKPSFRCDYGFNIFAGDNLFINYDCVILDCHEVRIGDNVLIGPKVQLYTALHPLDPAVRRTQVEMASPVSIGDDVWLGGGVIVCPGVRIGSGSTVGAGSVVTRDVPEKVFAAGNPCRVIREL